MPSLLFVLCLFALLQTVNGIYWQHGNCLAYMNQSKPFVANTANHCFIDYSAGIEYCLYSDCPPPPCKDPYHDGHICKTCPGKCQEGEHFYDPGTKFLSYDGFRKCICKHDPGFGAKMFCHKIDEPDPFNFCGIPYPFGYRKGVDLRSSQNFNNGVINNNNAHHNSLNNGGGPLHGGPFVPAAPVTNPPIYITAPPVVQPVVIANVAPQVQWPNNGAPAQSAGNQANNGAAQQWPQNNQNSQQQQQPNNGNHGSNHDFNINNQNGGGHWQNFHHFETK